MSMIRWISSLIAAAALVVGPLVPGASAKPGHETEAELRRIEIVGPGLVEPITLTPEEEEPWMLGLPERKWRVPNVDGALTPDAELGFSYRVWVFVRCDGSPRTLMQTLYPFAVGGPQILTPPYAIFCGETMPQGYFPAPVSVLEHFEARGLGRHIPDESTAASGSARSADETAAAGGGSSSNPALPLAVILAAAALVLAVLVMRRRGQLADQGSLGGTASSDAG